MQTSIKILAATCLSMLPLWAAAFQNSEIKVDDAIGQDSVLQKKEIQKDAKANVKFQPFRLEEKDTTAVTFQFSFVPFVGTNGIYSGNTVNDVSINLLGGYSAGTRAFEMAGLFNINRGNMTGVQWAGLFNQVGGQVDGVQMAGLFNSNLQDVRGVQLAGLTNFTTGSVDGIQLAGLVNFTPKKVKGVQLAGLLNFTAQDLHGTQVSGLANFVAKDVKGSQISPFNYASKVQGFQLGLFNYADSMSGVPVGLISFVRTGYHTVELSYNEVLPLNVALRTGKREFYNILFAGMRPEINEEVTWAFGYGIGTSPRLGSRLFLNIEASSEQLNRGNVEALNLVNRLFVGVDFQLAHKMALFAGPTFNFRVFDHSFTDHPGLFTMIQPQIHREKTHVDDLSSQLWWGFRAGIRFL
ncbi:hypothetical protein [Anditalea andensis]|uniref:Porin n=1 Tax=Anditalea andensis TaxID=1048983 RepID=A0A074KX84_9BACT|nr:hypothetical protein [Anditalea andensis]KEO72218.1 hypothetical protein EL17_18925 [Anditalea andensis]